MKKIKDLLLVEDSEIDTWLALRVLEISGICHSVITAGDGMEAFQKINAFYELYHRLPEVILVDLILPVLDGFEIIRRIKLHPAFQEETTRLVLVTEGLDEHVDLPLIQKHGIRHVLLKPVNKEKLIQSIFEEN